MCTFKSWGIINNKFFMFSEYVHIKVNELSILKNHVLSHNPKATYRMNE